MHRLTSVARQILLALAVICCAGCGKQTVKGRPSPVAVSGHVFVDDKPLEDVRIVLSPIDHRYAAAGVTDKNGRFMLQTFVKDDGAVPGKYKVLALNFTVKENPNGSVTETHFLPAKYRDPTKSELTAEVSEDGPNEIDFELDK